MSEQTKEILFEIQDLNKYFVLDKRNTLKAVNHVSLTIHKGETVGIVGESGCGKTTLGRTTLLNETITPDTKGLP